MKLAGPRRIHRQWYWVTPQLKDKEPVFVVDFMFQQLSSQLPCLISWRQLTLKDNLLEEVDEATLWWQRSDLFCALNEVNNESVQFVFRIQYYCNRNNWAIKSFGTIMCEDGVGKPSLRPEQFVDHSLLEFWFFFARKELWSSRNQDCFVFGSGAGSGNCCVPTSKFPVRLYTATNESHPHLVQVD